MDLIKNLGISYRAGYLVQGNQIERCNTSTSLNVKNTELQVRTDGKDSDISRILKAYKGNLVFHLPSVNPDLSNLDLVNNMVKELVHNNIKMVTINASNLSLELFEWSTLDEQKKYFLNIVTAIATIAANKIQVAVQNMKVEDEEKMFGSAVSQVTDIIVYARRLLIKDFGFNEEEAEKAIGICFNVNNIDKNSDTENLTNWLEIFGSYIKVIKLTNMDDLNQILKLLEEKEYDVPIFLETRSDLDEIKEEYTKFENSVVEYLKEKGISVEVKAKKEKNNKGFSNIIILTMISLTIAIVALMFIIKLR